MTPHFQDIDASRQRHQRQHSRRRQQWRRRLLMAAVTILLGVAAFVLTHRRDAAGPDGGEPLAIMNARHAPVPHSNDDSAVSSVSGRPVYPYSIVPGGTLTREDIEVAIRRDPVVAAHYEALDIQRLRLETIPVDRIVHVSYRMDGRIYWTGEPVVLRAGETVLTDGTTAVRTRCGNLISDEPQEPVALVEPDPAEFDRVWDWAWTPSGLGDGTDPSPPPPAPPGSDLLPPLVPTPLYAWSDGPYSGAPRRDREVPHLNPTTDTDQQGPSGPGPAHPDPAATLPEPDQPNPPEPAWPSWPLLPLPEPGAGDLLEPGIPLFPAPTDWADTESLVPPDRPMIPGPHDLDPLTPVPEPSTFVLVGLGGAAMLRMLRARRR